MEAILSNKKKPEYGSVTIPLPIPTAEYDHCMELLQSIEIGDPLAQDCRMEDLKEALPVLDCLLDQQVNVDELDFLARRVQGFDQDQAAQFSAAVYSQNIKGIRDLINMTFSTENVTVITDFAPDNLYALGMTHYQHMRGGAVSISELDHVNGEQVIQDLIASGKGQVTPYGVYYDNGMEIRELYKGRGFPEDEYTYRTLCATLTKADEPRTADDYAILHLPVPDSVMQRTLIRNGLNREKSLYLSLETELCPIEVLEAVGDDWNILLEDGILEDINAMCRSISGLSGDDLAKLGAVVQFAKPQDAGQVRQLAENLGQFEFVPDVRTPEEYGRHLLRNSGIGEDEKRFFDFEGYGKEQAALYDGQFNKRGYVAHHASITLEELMMDDPSGEKTAPNPHNRMTAVPQKKGKSHKRPER